MNGSDSQQNDHQAQSVFQNMTMTSVGLIPESFKVDLDQDDENSDVMGLMPHVDAMAMAAESSTGSAAVSKQPSAICIQPATAVTYQGDSFNISSAQVPSAASAGNVFQNVITYVAIPANFTPITVPITNIPQVNIESKPVIENVATLPVTTAPPLSEPITDEHWMEHDTPTSSMTCSVNEFLKTSRRKPNVDVKEEEVPASEDNAEVAGKLKKLEVRTLYVDFEKRKSDMIVLKEKFPSTNARQLDSLYMKMGCDLDRTVESLTQKMEEEQAKKLKALEEWRRNYDKNKVIKRVAAKNTVPPVTKRAKFDESGNEVYSPSANRPSTPDNQNLMYPNKRIPSDVRVYKQFFKRVEATDTGSKINAFMERNVVEYPASESEESARPVKMRTHVRHDYSPCVPRTTNNNSQSIFGTPNVTIDNSNSESTPTVTTSSAPPTTVSEANISQIEQSAQQTQQASVVPTAPVVVKKEEPRIGTGANIPSAATVSSGVLHTATKSESPLVSNEADGTDTEKSVSMLGLDDDNSCDHMDDDVEDDRLSDTSSNTRLSNSSGSGAVWPNKFFKNKITTAAAIHKRAYVSRELSQAWTGNKRVVPHNNPILEMTGNPAAISHSTPTMKGKPRPRVWTASSDAIPVNPGKLVNSYGSPYTPHLKIPTDSVESSPAPESFSASPDVKPIPVSPGDQLGDRSTVLDFFNTSEVEDIAAISNCSRKKANVIISMRPFLSLKDLSTRLDRERSLSSTLISGCKELLQMRASVSRLLMKCQKISNTVMPRISALTDQLNMESADSSQMQTTWDQPDCLNKEMSLKPYQILGVKWLKLLHSMNLNGILADEMGLGKTVQTIAFLASLMEMGDKGPHLVIVPSTTLENWCREFDIWCPSLRVLLYYGSFEERKAMRKEVYESGNSDFNIILTTYSVATSSIEDRTMMKRLDIHYGIFDEAHMLKNMTSQRYRYLMTFKIQRRLLLTGTPLQNNLLELMSLLSFVMPSLFAHRETTEVLKRLFQTCSRFRDDKTDASGGNLQTLSYEKQRILQAKSLLRPFILRRMKIHVLSQLPPKVDIVERVALPPVQRLRYVDLVTEIKDQLRRSGPDQESTSMAMLMQLRKAANHTLLHRRVFTNEMLREMARTLKKKEPSHKKAKEQLIYEDLCVLNDFEIHKICELYKDYIGSFSLSKETIISSSGKLMYLDAALPSMLAAGDRVLLFSQFVIVLDVIEEFLRLRGFRFVRLDGTTRVAERQELIDKFQTDPDVFICLMSTRCGGLGINLTAANVVILHDIDFNPHNDRQAEDRCHRVGQSKRVRVIRLLAANTLEEGMYRTATAKLRLEEDITGDFIAPYINVKHEPDEDDDDDDSEKRTQYKSTEAKQDEGTELSGAELKEVKELLHEALYSSSEAEKPGSSQVNQKTPTQVQRSQPSVPPAAAPVSTDNVVKSPSESQNQSVNHPNIDPPAVSTESSAISEASAPVTMDVTSSEIAQSSDVADSHPLPAENMEESPTSVLNPESEIVTTDDVSNCDLDADETVKQIPESPVHLEDSSVSVENATNASSCPVEESIVTDTVRADPSIDNSEVVKSVQLSNDGNEAISSEEKQVTSSEDKEMIPSAKSDVIPMEEISSSERVDAASTKEREVTSSEEKGVLSTVEKDVTSSEEVQDISSEDEVISTEETEVISSEANAVISDEAEVISSEANVGVSDEAEVISMEETELISSEANVDASDEAEVISMEETEVISSEANVGATDEKETISAEESEVVSSERHVGTTDEEEVTSLEETEVISSEANTAISDEKEVICAEEKVASPTEEKEGISTEEREVFSKKETCAAKHSDSQESAVDEVCSVQSSNEKGSNPSEISEDSRPLVISELRGSTDSEEIDVVGET